jgi:c-di-GMP-binding flagellar brake protein YcgR
MAAAQDAATMFTEAARTRALAVLTVQNDGRMDTYKCRFLEAHPGRGFFVLDYPGPGETAMPELAPGQFVGISFRHKSRKVLFATVVEAKGKYVVDSETSIAAVRYRWPQSLTELQRRAYVRTPIPGDTRICATLWHGGAGGKAAADDSSDVMRGRLLDLSCGGALIRLSTTNPTPLENATLGMELELPDGRPPATTDVQYRGARYDESGAMCVAVQFVGLEMTLDGRVLLQRIAGSVQRWNRAGAPLGAPLSRDGGGAGDDS